MVKTLTLIVGARPNFVKIAPLMRELQKHPRYRVRLIHTGQHYDEKMSDSFFSDLGIYPPTENFGVGSGSHAEQTAAIMVRFEKELLENPSDALIVVGDVNSTMATALVASKLGTKIMHIEAGLRSFDRSMPEEINRLVTDALSDVFFTTDPYADENLRNEGHSVEKIVRVGNIMIDSLVHHLPQAKAKNTYAQFGLSPKGYFLATLHRPSNVDHPETLVSILDAFVELSTEIPIVFPVHPRTKQKIESSLEKIEKSHLILTEPFGYLDMLCMTSHAKGLLTDSGGLQEEGCYLRVPTLTLRPNTERPITIDCGTNRLVASEKKAIVDNARAYLTQPALGSAPELWDGKTAERIVGHLKNWI